MSERTAAMSQSGPAPALARQSVAGRMLSGGFAIVLVFAVLGTRIYISLLITAPPLILVALGLTLVIAAGQIDLSFPSAIAFSGFIFAASYRFDNVGYLAFLSEGLSAEEIDAMREMTLWLGLVGAVLGGMLVGWVNGILVARVGIPAIIATLATLFLWRGLAIVFAAGLSYNLRGVKDTLVWRLTTGRLIEGVDLPIQAFWAVALTVALWFLLNRHRFGEALLFIGDNEQVARVMGIDVVAVKIRLFTLMGALGGLSGVFLTAENITFYTNQGQGFLLLAMAGVFIGGTSIFGGSGRIVGSVIGILLVLVVQAGIVAAGVQGFWNDVVIGLIFIVAVIVHMLVEQPDRFRGLGLR